MSSRACMNADRPRPRLHRWIVTQNSVANGKITRNTPFKEVYIPSAGHDAGISMGSAQYHWHHDLGRNRVAPIVTLHRLAIHR